MENDLPDAVFTSIFKNCLNLQTLKLFECDCEVKNERLIEWASRGGQLSKLVLDCCFSVTEEGILPISINSANRLRRFVWLGSEFPQRLGDPFWRGLFSHCPFLEEVDGCPEEYEHLTKTKCYNMMHKVRVLHERRLMYKH